VFIIYGGVIWLVSSGNVEMVIKGKKILIGSMMGLLIIVSSWVLINALIIGLTGQKVDSIGQIFGQDWYKVEREGEATGGGGGDEQGCCDKVLINPDGTIKSICEDGVILSTCKKDGGMWFSALDYSCEIPTGIPDPTILSKCTEK